MAISLIFFSLFLFGVWRFQKRPSPPSPTSKATLLSFPVVKTVDPVPLSSALAGEEVFLSYNTAVLTDVTGGVASGTATREAKDGLYVLSLRATLPQPEREKQSYEGWLVRQAPFDFFSLGKLINIQEGDYSLEWRGEGGKEYGAYERVVVTVEEKDPDSFPGTHVLEGEFQN